MYNSLELCFLSRIICNKSMTIWLVFLSAAYRARTRSCLRRMEWGANILPSHIQVFKQFRQICRRWKTLKTKKENSSMVVFLMCWVINLKLYHCLCKSNPNLCSWRCDRILWYGRGLRQLSYVRGESRFSDHRPVYSMFLAEVESVSRNRIRKCSSCASSRIEVEELLPHSNGYSYTDLNFFWWLL